MQLPLRRRIADLVWRWRRTTYAVSTMGVLAALVVVFLSVASPSTTVEVSDAPTFFDARRALRLAEELARLYPDRTPGSEDASGAVAWLKDKLGSMGVEVAAKQESIPSGREHINVENVWTILPGTSSETILVSASRDPTGDVSQPLVASATGTAILLELVQVFASHPHEKTLIFLSSEGGSRGGLGLSAFLGSYPDRSRISAVVSIQSLGMENRSFLYANTQGPGSATPGWLVDVTARVLSRSNIRLRVPNLQDQIAGHAVRLYSGEQVAGLRFGVASIQLYDKGQGNVTVSGLMAHGPALERLLMSLDDAGPLPRIRDTAIVLASGKYISRSVLAVLALLLILPALAMTATWLLATQFRPSTWAAHLKNAASFALPILALLFLAWAAAKVGLIPLYLRHGILGPPEAVRPRWGVAASLVLVGLILFFISRHFLGHLRPSGDRATAEAAKLVSAFLLLSLGSVLIASSSPFSLVPVLSAVWIWPLCTVFLEPPSLVVSWWPNARSNAWITLAGLLAPAAFYAYLATHTAAGWTGAWWLALLQVVSGMFGVAVPVGFSLIAAAFPILLGSRRLPLEPLEHLDQIQTPERLPPVPPRVVRVRRRSRRTQHPVL